MLLALSGRRARAADDRSDRGATEARPQLRILRSRTGRYPRTHAAQRAALALSSLHVDEQLSIAAAAPRDATRASPTPRRRPPPRPSPPSLSDRSCASAAARIAISLAARSTRSSAACSTAHASRTPSRRSQQRVARGCAPSSSPMASHSPRTSALPASGASLRARARPTHLAKRTTSCRGSTRSRSRRRRSRACTRAAARLPASRLRSMRGGIRRRRRGAASAAQERCPPRAPAADPRLGVWAQASHAHAPTRPPHASAPHVALSLPSLDGDGHRSSACRRSTKSFARRCAARAHAWSGRHGCS